MRRSIAIVGSGPSGFYTAEALLKACDDVEIDIIERLPTPYGLIRGGVAPDHAKTKNVARAYERTAQDPRVCYFGNVEVGRDVSLRDLRECYDAVVLATGASVDRPLGIPGDDKKGVVGVAAFVGWYNGHPDFRDLDPDLDTGAAAVIGIGNVAVDVARVLTKTPAEMASTDLTDYAAAAIHAAPINDVYMFGRRGPLQAQFSNVELRELGFLENAYPVLDPAQLPDAVPEAIAAKKSARDLRLIERNLETLREFSQAAPGGREKRIHFSFFANPVEILGGDRVEGLRLERTVVDADERCVGTGEFFEVECGLVIPAIGYFSEPIDGVPFDRGRSVNDDGRIEKGLYAVGWVKRGPSGVIGTNKPDGDTAAQQICADCPNGRKPGRAALEAMLAERGAQWLTFDDWKQIDAAEVSAARNGAPRRKFATVAEMLAVVDHKKT
jgi:NADPH-dependent glutamate synthase beta subunit-like oxidoreductase